MEIKNILIVGADGQVGKALSNAYASINYKVYETTRNKESINSTRVYFELSDNLHFDSLPIDAVDTVIICAGITRLRDCHENPQQSRFINVHQTRKLAEYLFDKGKFVVFLSTNLVFDGSVPFVETDMKPCPTTEYGRQKAETETNLQLLSDHISIVRVSKIIGPGNALLTHWKKSLDCGEKIKAYSDLFMSPVPLSTVTKAIQKIVEHKMAGIVQLSANQDISYFDTAIMCADLLNVNADLVHAIPSDLLQGIYSSPAKFTTLDTRALTKEMRIDIPDVEWTISKFIENPEVFKQH